MFKILKHSKVLSSDLVSSQLFDEHSFYETFIHDLRRSKTEVIIESPYITCRRVNQLLPILKKLIKRGVKVTMNTRNPQHHDELLRIQAYMAFKILKPTGVKIRTFNDYHHRKIAVIDGRVLYEGSPADERFFLPLFSPYVDQGEIANLPAYNFYLRISGVKTYEPMSGETVVLDDRGSVGNAKIIIESSRINYSKKTTLVTDSTSLPMIEQNLRTRDEPTTVNSRVSGESYIP